MVTFLWKIILGGLRFGPHRNGIASKSKTALRGCEKDLLTFAAHGA
jgi:hypothetical protein